MTIERCDLRGIVFDEYDGYYTHWTPLAIPQWCSCCEQPSSGLTKSGDAG
jgi:hypothetical protein